LHKYEEREAKTESESDTERENNLLTAHSLSHMMRKENLNSATVTSGWWFPSCVFLTCTQL